MDNTPHSDPAQRMQTYLQKIAAGPKMSKDLTREEAEDGLSLVLNGSVSQVRAGIFLIASRMKLETVEENIGYWQALDKTTVQHEIAFEKILAIADPFDGFNRVPYFGFFIMPVLAAMGLPAYGHSSHSLPPKFGITFEDLLGKHYGVSPSDNGDKRIALLKKFRFAFLSTRHTNPPLENLRNLRMEIIKRPMLATLEKMLMPVKVSPGGNFLASGYFHKGYEVPMLAVARLSGFDKTILGNGVEGTTFYGVHKDARVFIASEDEEPIEKKLVLENLLSTETCDLVKGTFQDLKKETATLEFLSAWGEEALKNNQGPAAVLIACHAGMLCYLLGMFKNPQEGFDAARDILKVGDCYIQLMKFLEEIK